MTVEKAVRAGVAPGALMHAPDSGVWRVVLGPGAHMRVSSGGSSTLVPVLMSMRRVGEGEGTTAGLRRAADAQVTCTHCVFMSVWLKAEEPADAAPITACQGHAPGEEAFRFGDRCECCYGVWVIDHARQNGRADAQCILSKLIRVP
jgi:hypothetical protein